MTALSWREGAQELRRLVAVEAVTRMTSMTWTLPSGPSGRSSRCRWTVSSPAGKATWRRTRWSSSFLSPSDWSDDRPGLLIARRFAIPAVEWRDGAPGEPSGGGDDLALADTVQIQMELRFPRGTTADADDFWTAIETFNFLAPRL